MASTYTSQLRLEKPAAGDYDNSWNLVWDNTLPLVEQGIGGYVTVALASDANYTLTTSNGADDQARNMVLNVTSGVPLTVTRSIIVPNVEKVYIVSNNTTGDQAIRISTAAPSTTVDIPNGRTCLVYVNGTGESVTLVGTVIPTGSAAAPGLAFQTDNDTGIYLNTTNTIGFAAGGSLQVTISTTASTFSQPVLLPNGTVDAPALAPSGDTNTGIYFPSGDTMRLTVGGKTTISVATDAVIIAPNFTTSATFATDNVAFPFPVLFATGGTYSAPTLTFDTEESTGIYRHAANEIGFTNSGSTTVTVSQDAVTIIPQVVLNTTGDQSDPPLTFAGDTNTGIYRSNDGEISVTCNGTKVFTFSTVGAEGVAPVVFADGSATAPSITNNGDLDTGIYFPANNQVGVAGNTQNIATFTTAGIITSFPIFYQDGSATEPAISNFGDANTGIYFPSTDAVGVTAGGELSLTVSSSAITAAKPVVFSSSGGDGTPSITFAGDTTTGIYWDEAGSFGLTSDGNAVATIDGDGVHLIEPLFISSTGSESSPTLTFEGDTDTGIFRSAADAIKITAGGTTIQTITTTGNTVTVPVVIPLGAIGAPSLTFAGDLDTGIYSAGANTVSIVGNGGAIAAFTTTATGILAGGSTALAISTTGVTPYAGGVAIGQFSADGLNVTTGGIRVGSVPVVHGRYQGVSSTPYTVLSSNEYNGTHYGVNTSSTSITMNLPALSGLTGYRFTITKLASTNEVIIDADGAEDIDGFTSIKLYSLYDTVTLVNNGSRWVVAACEIADHVTTFAATDASYSLKAGCAQIEAWLQGAGGGGGGCTGSATSPSGTTAGGGGGGALFHVISGDMSGVSTLAITIGAGGTAGANTGGNGGSGGATTLGFSPGTNLWTANGGAGGVGNTVKTTTGVQLAGGGIGQLGAITTGSNNIFSETIAGKTGAMGMLFIDAASVGISGGGGTGGVGSIGGTARITSGNGSAGGVGSGGSGALNLTSNTARTGGAGGDGVVVLRQIFVKKRYVAG